MTITQELIDSLHDGDLVRLKHTAWKYPIEGKVEVLTTESKQVGGFIFTEYTIKTLADLWDLEVLERAPRFYVNCDRAPVPGDVCRVQAEYETNRTTTWSLRADDKWYPTHQHHPIVGEFYGAEVLLIVDGETGLPVMPDGVRAELRHLREVAEL